MQKHLKFNMTMSAPSGSHKVLHRAVLLFIMISIVSCSKHPTYPPPPSDADMIRIPVSSVRDGRPLFYTFRTSSGKGISFFVVMVEGELQSYFDACAKCYPERLGYRTDDDHVVCRACDVRYALRDLKEGIGSCYPIRLPGRVDVDAYVVSKKDLLKGERFF